MMDRSLAVFMPLPPSDRESVLITRAFQRFDESCVQLLCDLRAVGTVRSQGLADHVSFNVRWPAVSGWLRVGCRSE
jgi:hypothetical protein